MIVWCQYYFIINCSGWNDLFLSLLHSCSILKYLNNRLWKQAIRYIAHECWGFVFPISTRRSRKGMQTLKRKTRLFHVNFCWTKKLINLGVSTRPFQNRSYFRHGKLCKEFHGNWTCYVLRTFNIITWLRYDNFYRLHWCFYFFI